MMRTLLAGLALGRRARHRRAARASEASHAQCQKVAGGGGPQLRVDAAEIARRDAVLNGLALRGAASAAATPSAYARA